MTATASTNVGAQALGSSEPRINQPGRPVRSGFRRLARALTASSLVVGVCVSLKLPLLAPIVFAYFVWLRGRYQLDASELIVIWLVVTPFLGPYFVAEIGFLPAFGFHRFFVFLAIATLLREPGIRRRSLITNQLDYAVIGLLGAILLSIVFGFLYKSPIRIFLDAVLVPAAFYFIAKKCVGNAGFPAKLFFASVLAVTACGALGIFEAVTEKDILDFGEKEQDVFRANGPMGMAEPYGLVMNMLLLFGFAMSTFRKERVIRPRYLQLAAVIGILAVVGTNTRGVWISLGAGWLVLYARKKGAKFFIVVPLLAVAMWMFFQFVVPWLAPDVWEKRVKNERTIYARFATYMSCWAMFKDHPVFGVGYTAFPEIWERFPERYSKEYKNEPSVSTPHNVIFSLLAETGLTGVSAALVLFLSAIALCFHLSRRARTPVQRDFADAGLSVLVAYLVAGMGCDFTHSIDFVNRVLFLVLGSLSGMADQVRWGNRTGGIEQQPTRARVKELVPS